MMYWTCHICMAPIIFGGPMLNMCWDCFKIQLHCTHEWKDKNSEYKECVICKLQEKNEKNNH